MRISFAIVLAVIATGCASNSTIPGKSTATSATLQSSNEKMGTLIVFSEWDRLSNSSDSVWIRHTDYSIYDADGNLVRQVKNHNMGPDSRPVALQLPAGKYVVKARKQGSGWVSVPVILAAGNTSDIYLDDSSRPLPAPNHTIQVIK
jgi:hypothetical protein